MAVPVGVETLAAALAEARDTLEDVVEPYPDSGGTGAAHESRPGAWAIAGWAASRADPAAHRRAAATRSALGCSSEDLQRIEPRYGFTMKIPMPAASLYHAQLLGVCGTRPHRSSARGGGAGALRMLVSGTGSPSWCAVFASSTAARSEMDYLATVDTVLLGAARRQPAPAPNAVGRGTLGRRDPSTSRSPPCAWPTCGRCACRSPGRRMLDRFGLRDRQHRRVVVRRGYQARWSSIMPLG